MSAKTPTRKIISTVVSFCVRYDYIGASWDGKELTLFGWRKQSEDPDWLDGDIAHTQHDTLEPFGWQELKPSMQQSEWLNLEQSLENVQPFAWGYTLLPASPQAPDDRVKAICRQCNGTHYRSGDSLRWCPETS